MPAAFVEGTNKFLGKMGDVLTGKIDKAWTVIANQDRWQHGFQGSLVQALLSVGLLCCIRFFFCVLSLDPRVGIRVEGLMRKM